MTETRLPLRAFLVAQLLASAPLLTAAITVDGLSDESTHTSGSITFSVPSEADFDIVAELNGSPLPLDAPHTETGAGYHELFVTKTPSGGGTTEEETLQFIVRDPARPLSDNGMPTWTPPQPVDSPDAVLDTTTVSFFTPAIVTPGLSFPFVIRLENGSGRIAMLNATALVSDADGNSSTLRLHRGAGAGWWTAPATGPFTINLRLGSRSFARQIDVSTPDVESLSGTLASSRTFAAGTAVDVTTDTTVPAGTTLRFEPGCIVRLAEAVEIEVLGTLEIAGTTTSPVLFLPADPATVWGGFYIHGTSASATVAAAALTGAGYDQDRVSSHRKEQPVFIVDDCSATFTDTWIVDNPVGQAVHGNDSTVTFTRCLIQRTRTSGQFNGGAVNFHDSHAIEFPVDSDEFLDADNDGIYLNGGDHHFRDSVIGWAKDDGIDCGGSAVGTLLVEDCWLEACYHEAFALSGDKMVTTTGTVMTANGQGFEVGYSNTGSSLARPDATATGCLITGNAHGVRYGDNYDWTYRGKLQVESSLLVHNIADVFGFEWDSWDYRGTDMTIENNTVTRPLDRHPVNTVLDPATAAPQVAPFIDQPAMARGFGIAARDPQNPRATYGGSIGVQLDRPASDAISIDWKVLAMPTVAGGGEIEVAGGTLAFPAGATSAALDLPALTGAAATAEWIAVIFDDAPDAVATGPGSCHFLDLESSFEPELVAFGSDWHYLADGSDQGTAWREPGFSHSWPSGPGQLGYGNGDEATIVPYVDTDPGTSGTQKNATTYFRHQFTVDDPSGIDSLSLELLYDDAGIVHLNGQRVAASSNMPAEEVAYDYYVGTALPGQGNARETFTIPATALVPGGNTLAVEIHQAGPTSSDISFDLALTATPGQAAAIEFTSATLDGHLHLFWNNPEIVPQSSPDLESWIQRPDLRSPLVVKPRLPGTAREFYRLSLP